MSSDTTLSWIKFLNPQELKNNLTKTSIYIVFFELLKTTIIDKVKGFYWSGFENGKDIYDNEYKKRFLMNGVSLLDESINWFVEHGAITNDEKIEIIKLKDHRNEIAHNLLEIIASSDKEVKDELLVSCYKILSKIDKWWILEVELPTNPNVIELSEVDEEKVMSMSMIVLQLLYKIYIGDDQGLDEIYRKFQETVVPRLD